MRHGVMVSLGSCNAWICTRSQDNFLGACPQSSKLIIAYPKPESSTQNSLSPPSRVFGDFMKSACPTPSEPVKVVGNTFIGKSTNIQILSKALSKLRQDVVKSGALGHEAGD